MILRKPWLVLSLVLAAGAARAQTPDHWFLPSGASATGGPTVDTSLGKGAAETVVVIAKRRDRSWRSQITEQLNQPMASDAARPRHSFEKQKPYCNSALRTVGGQPATAADMMVGAGAGGC